MLPSVGTPPIDAAVNFVMDLLIQERNQKEQNKTLKPQKKA
jgi:hypothetical protein